MKKVLVFVIALLAIVCVCLLIFKINLDKEEKNYNEENNIDVNENIENNEVNNDKNEKENGSESYNMKLVINDKEYDVNLEHNDTVTALIDILPLDIKMSELNSNEKYFYLDNSLPTNSNVPERIEKGDIMLYGDNCLVLFYKSFATNYSYTKIGHIDNLIDLDSSDINVKVIK